MIIAIISLANSIAALAMMISTARLSNKLFKLWFGAYIFHTATVILYLLRDRDDTIVWSFFASFSIAIIFQFLSLKSEEKNNVNAPAIVFSVIYTAVLGVSYLYFYWI